jgi:hypothetical protein
MLIICTHEKHLHPNILYPTIPSYKKTHHSIFHLHHTENIKEAADTPGSNHQDLNGISSPSHFDQRLIAENEKINTHSSFKRSIALKKFLITKKTKNEFEVTNKRKFLMHYRINSLLHRSWNIIII